MPFLVFEGLDGSGKSSLMNAIEEELVKSDISFVRTREPGGTPLGDEIRELILSKDGDAPTARTELLLYEASRSQHVDKVIRPALNQNKWVLCDRFTASSVAFQAGGRQISEEWVESLNTFATDDLKPDLVVLLDLSVDESKKRRNQRQNNTGSTEDRIESEADSFHERVRQGFLSQAKKDAGRWLVLDASKSPEELKKICLDKIRSLNWFTK